MSASLSLVRTPVSSARNSPRTSSGKISAHSACNRADSRAAKKRADGCAHGMSVTPEARSVSMVPRARTYSSSCASVRCAVASHSSVSPGCGTLAGSSSQYKTPSYSRPPTGTSTAARQP